MTETELELFMGLPWPYMFAWFSEKTPHVDVFIQFTDPATGYVGVTLSVGMN